MTLYDYKYESLIDKKQFSCKLSSVKNIIIIGQAGVGKSRYLLTQFLNKVSCNGFNIKIKYFNFLKMNHENMLSEICAYFNQIKKNRCKTLTLIDESYTLRDVYYYRLIREIKNLIVNAKNNYLHLTAISGDSRVIDNFDWEVKYIKTISILNSNIKKALNSIIRICSLNSILFDSKDLKKRNFIFATTLGIPRRIITYNIMLNNMSFITLRRKLINSKLQLLNRENLLYCCFKRIVLYKKPFRINRYCHLKKKSNVIENLIKINVLHEVENDIYTIDPIFLNDFWNNDQFLLAKYLEELNGHRNMGYNISNLIKFNKSEWNWMM